MGPFGVQAENGLAILHEVEFVPRDGLNVLGIILQQINLALLLLAFELLGFEKSLLLGEIFRQFVPAFDLGVKPQDHHDDDTHREEDSEDLVEGVPKLGAMAAASPSSGAEGKAVAGHGQIMGKAAASCKAAVKKNRGQARRLAPDE